MIISIARWLGHESTDNATIAALRNTLHMLIEANPHSYAHVFVNNHSLGSAHSSTNRSTDQQICQIRLVDAASSHLIYEGLEPYAVHRNRRQGPSTSHDEDPSVRWREAHDPIPLASILLHLQTAIWYIRTREAAPSWLTVVDRHSWLWLAHSRQTI